MPAAGLRPAPDVANPADIVVRNARIYSGDRAQPTASAVAISGGVFAAVGDDAAVAGHVGANTRIVDWLGRRPGLNNSHMHIIRGATGKGAVDGE
jgi:predicted amidohydrolase YtcJ